MENIIQKRTDYSYRVFGAAIVVLGQKTNEDKINQHIKFVFFYDMEVTVNPYHLLLFSRSLKVINRSKGI